MTDINIESPVLKALRPAMLAVPLERLALSTRPSNRLEDAGISVVGEIPWGPNGILPFEKIEQDVLDEIQSAVIAFERRNLPFLLGFDPFEVKWSDQLGGRVPDGGVAPEGHHDAGLAGLVRRPRLAG